MLSGKPSISYDGEPEVTAPPDRVQPGKCYLLETGHVRRVIRLMPDGRVQYEGRVGHQRAPGAWRPGMQDIRSFAFLIEREVPCDWSPETDERA